ncbi:hypothetical protein PIB30_061679 [Stylosanthes scabra]|uniref:Uncharacterized protein n=1 Tax=Stylosanthes scabra TaxID=79078 RepID=A0ABU6WMK5_9FABA|nr:hypothetical protein [Stylosanthes scabra]
MLCTVASLIFQIVNLQSERTVEQIQGENPNHWILSTVKAPKLHKLKRCDYDLVAWRKSIEPHCGPELRRGFDLLDLDGGIGWELLTSMGRFVGTVFHAKSEAAALASDSAGLRGSYQVDH